MNKKQKSYKQQFKQDFLIAFFITVLFLLGVTVVVVLKQRTATTTPLELVVPYESIQNLESLGPFSVSAQTPFGVYHNGMDFLSQQTMPFHAIADGTVKKIEVLALQPTGNYDVNIEVKINSVYWYNMGFEIVSTKQADLNAQLNAIDVVVGQKIEAGQLVGTLLPKGEGAHVHVSVKTHKKDICFFPLFPKTVQKEMFPKLRIPPGVTRQACYE